MKLSFVALVGLLFSVQSFADIPVAITCSPEGRSIESYGEVPPVAGTYLSATFSLLGHELAQGTIEKLSTVGRMGDVINRDSQVARARPQMTAKFNEVTGTSDITFDYSDELSTVEEVHVFISGNLEESPELNDKSSRILVINKSGSSTVEVANCASKLDLN